MKTAYLIITVYFVLLFSINLNAQSKNKKSTPYLKNKMLTLDVAELNIDDTSSYTFMGKFDKIELKNIFPNVLYRIDVKKSTVLLSPLTFTAVATTTKGLKLADVVWCDPLKELINEGIDLAKISDPKNQGKTEKDIETYLSKLDTISSYPNCSDLTKKNLEEKVYSLKEVFRRNYDIPIDIGGGDRVEITVSSELGKRVWIFEGRENGEWVMTYGFGFTSKSLESDPYYSKQVVDSSNFIITQADPSGSLNLNYVPAVFYSYFFYKYRNSLFNPSLTAGLGFDISAPVVFLGFNTLYKHNIGLSLGVAFQQQQLLKANYHEGDYTTTYLDEGALHDPVYRINAFIAVNFRFGKNPFDKTEANLAE